MTSAGGVSKHEGFAPFQFLAVREDATPQCVQAWAVQSLRKGQAAFVPSVAASRQRRYFGRAVGLNVGESEAEMQQRITFH